MRWPWKRGSSTIAPPRASACRRSRGTGRPSSRIVPRRRSGESEQHPDQRRLTGAVRPEVAEGDAAGDVQVDAVDGASVTEALGQAGRLDDIRRLPFVRCSCVRMRSSGGGGRGARCRPSSSRRDPGAVQRDRYAGSETHQRNAGGALTQPAVGAKPTTSVHEWPSDRTRRARRGVGDSEVVGMLAFDVDRGEVPCAAAVGDGDSLRARRSADIVGLKAIAEGSARRPSGAVHRPGRQPRHRREHRPARRPPPTTTSSARSSRLLILLSRITSLRCRDRFRRYGSRCPAGIRRRDSSALLPTEDATAAVLQREKRSGGTPGCTRPAW